MYPRHEMLDLVRRRRPRARHRRRATWSPARSSRTSADAVVLATGGYGNVFYLSTNAKGCNVTAIWRAYKKGAVFANPCYTQIHPTCIPVSGDYQSKLTLMCESLRNDGRVWVPKQKGDKRPPGPDPRGRARLLPRAQVPELRQPRAARHRLARGQGGVRRGPRRRPRRAAASISTSPTPSSGSARRRSRERYGNLFDMYERITGENPYQVPMRIYPAVALHDGRAVGGLQPDEHDPRAVRARRGELLRPRRQPPRRERADAGAGRRLLHPPLHHRRLPGRDASSAGVDADHPEFKRVGGGGRGARRSGCSAIKGKRTVDSFHRELGKLMWDYCGMARNDAGPARRRSQKIPELREEFWQRRAACSASERGAEPGAGEGRPRRRLPRARAS